MQGAYLSASRSHTRHLKRGVTGGSAHSDDCCGITRVAARRLLAHLKATKYRDHRLELFRQSLLRVLEKKAAATNNWACDHIKCALPHRAHPGNERRSTVRMNRVGEAARLGSSRMTPLLERFVRTKLLLQT
jgi:hypothetical protein